MRNLSLLCRGLLTFSIFACPDKTYWDFYALVASLLLIIISLVITTVIKVPINWQEVTWTDGREKLLTRRHAV